MASASTIVTLLEGSCAYGADELLNKADFSLEDGEKVCLVGRNGTGKSTLLKLIAGQRELDSGRLILRNDLKLAMLPQDPPAYASGCVYTLCAKALPVCGEALARYYAATDEHISKLSEAPALDEHELAELSAFIETHDGWKYDQKIRKVLSQVGLEASLELKNLSGGLRRKAALCSALCHEPQLLLLDEPTNHLDIESISWFEKWLNDFEGTVIFVTHDRTFADHCASRIVELDRGKLYSYPGKFSDYQRLREDRLRLEELSNKEFDRILSQEEAWIRRGVKARLARNEGRVRDLEERRRIRSERRSIPQKVSLKANTAERSGNLIFELRQVRVDYEGSVLIKPFDAMVMRGDRIGIIGHNGCGKTTLLKILQGLDERYHGYVRRGMGIELEYFDQYFEQLKNDQSVFDNVADGHSEVFINGKSRHVNSYLADFLFTAKRARSKVSSLSGGERNRLLLAKLFAKPSNVLILDEPTNDLDLETLELLEEQVAAYPGTVLVVSHDRSFIDKVATETWVFGKDGQIENIIGGYQEVLAYYERTGRNPDGSPQNPVEENPITALAKKEAKSKESRTFTEPTLKNKISYSERHELKSLPGKIEVLEAELAKLDELLSDPNFYAEDKYVAAGEQSSVDKIRDTRQKRDELQQELDTLYARWEDLESRSFDDKQ